VSNFIVLLNQKKVGKIQKFSTEKTIFYLIQMSADLDIDANDIKIVSAKPEKQAQILRMLTQFGNQTSEKLLCG
jgi:hypothetical protein